nr:hypothetical protein LTR18_005179 [Exophiala xenobiotica]
MALYETTNIYLLAQPRGFVCLKGSTIRSWRQTTMMSLTYLVQPLQTHKPTLLPFSACLRKCASKFSHTPSIQMKAKARSVMWETAAAPDCKQSTMNLMARNAPNSIPKLVQLSSSSTDRSTKKVARFSGRPPNSGFALASACVSSLNQSTKTTRSSLDEIICGKTTDTLLTMPFVMIRHNQQRVDEYMMNLVLSSKEVGANLSVFLDDVQDMLDTVYLDGNTTWSKCLVENIQGHPNYGYLGNKPVRLVLKKEAAAGGGIKYINGGVAVTTLPDPPALDLLWAKLCFWLSIPVRDRQPLAVFSRQCDQLFDYETGESSLVPRRPGLFVID